MAKAKSNRKHLIPAVGYLRRSTRKQEQSIDDQKREIRRYAAANGYCIIRWYEDDGISGDATEKRTDFQEMLRAATNGRDFDVILCWDQDRFSRSDPAEAISVLHELRRAGVRLVTVTKGPVDLTDPMGWLLYGVEQTRKHQFLHDLSRATARGQISSARKGNLTGQAANYGFDRMLVDSAGNHKQRVHNGEQVAKPREWHTTLVPSDDPEKVATLRWIFDTYASSSIGLRGLADELNRRRIPGPRGETWCVGTVSAILRNAKYVGEFQWPMRRMGKYHRVSGEDIQPRDASELDAEGNGRTMRNDESELTIFKNAHEALVGHETFARVQQKLAERRKCTTPGKGKGRHYVLSKLIFCAHCGRPMHGRPSRRKKKGKTYEQLKYLCSNFDQRGPASGCGAHGVQQAPLVAFLLNKLQTMLLADGNRKQLRQRIVARLETEKLPDPKRLDALRSRLDELDRLIDRGRRRLLTADDDEYADLKQAMADARRERERLAAELASAERTTTVDIEAEADEALDRLWTLADDLDIADPVRLKEALKRIVQRIELHFGRVEKRTRVECPLQSGRVLLQPHLYGLVSRGERI